MVVRREQHGIRQVAASRHVVELDDGATVTGRGTRIADPPIAREDEAARIRLATLGAVIDMAESLAPSFGAHGG
jgi:hypothetical protein